MMRVFSSKKTLTILAAVAAGIVVLLVSCSKSAHDEVGATVPASESVKSTEKSGEKAETHKKRTVAKPPKDGKPVAQRKKSNRLSPAVMRLLIRDAIDSNNHDRLAILLNNAAASEDPEVRLELLQALSWFDETAVEDAVGFLLDEDERVAATASEIVTARISSVPSRPTRQKLYLAALKTMPATADRDILLATLESEDKLFCLRVITGLESVRELRPDLWEKVAETYESVFGRPYVNATDALMNFNPREP